MLRSKLKKLTAQISDAKENLCSPCQSIVANEYWSAIRSNNDEAILKFERYGTDVLKRIKNLATYRNNAKVGFLDFDVNHFGWLMSAKIEEVEEISLKLPSDNALYNHIVLGQVPNGDWCYGLRMEFCNGGSWTPLTVYNNFFTSKENCINEALKMMKSSFLNELSFKCISQSYKSYCRQILSLINKELQPKRDFSFNKKGQIMLF